MPVDVSAVDQMMPDAIRRFWGTRTAAVRNQNERGTVDQGNRSAVTSGKAMDGFIEMIERVVTENGMPSADVHRNTRASLTIPGFYRPTKMWDLLVVNKGLLVAALEFKSQVGPSFGNNFNNRVEEAIGNATDLATAFREEAFGDSPKPFLGFFFTLEECDKSATPVRVTSPHFSILPEFEDTSYIDRYEILCKKLVQEQLYDAATLVLTNEDDSRNGDYRVRGDFTSPQRFAATLAGRVAGMVAG